MMEKNWNGINNKIRTIKTKKQFTTLNFDKQIYFMTMVHYLKNVAKKSIGIDKKSILSKI